MKSAPKQLKAILVQAKSCLPREEQEAATATSHALKVEMDFQILKQMRWILSKRLNFNTLIALM